MIEGDVPFTGEYTDEELDKMAALRFEAARLERMREEKREREAAQIEAETTMAEEPIEDRLRRAFMNGFREGVEMASWRRGQWDFV
jgi:cobalamin-dependent methionine synthase I